MYYYVLYDLPPLKLIILSSTSNHYIYCLTDKINKIQVKNDQKQQQQQYSFSYPDDQQNKSFEQQQLNKNKLDISKT